MKKYVDYEGAGVYAITNSSTGRKYIGSSKNINRRIYQHFADLSAGRHCNMPLQNDYNAGAVFDCSVLLQTPCSNHEELMRRESMIISSDRDRGIDLYNVFEMTGDYYLSKSHIINRMADLYCRERTGLSLNQFFMRNEAAYNMLFRIMLDPDHEQEIRSLYEPAVDYQNKEKFYQKRLHISYSDYLMLTDEEQKQLKRSLRRNVCP